jgi:hypothetical protein
MRLLCESCGRAMAFEFHIPQLGPPGACHEYHSCECGFVTSQAYGASRMLHADEREIGKIRLRLDKEFLKWARFSDERQSR